MTQEATDTVSGGYRMLARLGDSHFLNAIMLRLNLPSGMRPPDSRSRCKTTGLRRNDPKTRQHLT
jgi:hypothetical protein